jgi:hypothetical protein
MKAEDLEFLFNFPVDRVDQECRASDAPKYCDGKDSSGKMIVLRALLPLTGDHTAEVILCAKHMEDCVEALGDFMEQGVAKVRRQDELGG